MEEKNLRSEFLLVKQDEEGHLEISWSIQKWRFEYCALVNDHLQTLNIRLVSSMKNSSFPAYVIDSKVKSLKGSLTFSEPIPYSSLRVEIGGGEGDNFIPFIYSEMELHISLNGQNVTPSWKEKIQADQSDMLTYSSLYSFYGRTETQLAKKYPTSLFPETCMNESRPTQRVKKRSLRILMLSWEYPPYIQGGLGRHVFELSKQLAAGHKVTVLTLGGFGAPRQEEVEGVSVYRTEEVIPNFKDYHLFIAQVNMKLVELAKSLIAHQEFDLIHGHDWQVGYAARYLKKILYLPLISTIHALENGRSTLEQEIHQQIDKKEMLLMEESDELIVCSSYMKREIQDKSGSTQNKIYVIPNGVKLSSVESDSMEAFIHRYHTYKKVLFLGRLVPEKGVDTLIMAAALLQDCAHRIKFVIAGDGPLLSTYRHRVTQIGLQEQFLFVGFLHEHEKTTMLKHTDILVIPSYYEPFGIVALEGMAAGKAILTSQTGGLVEILEDGQTGMFFSPGDEKDLAEKLLQLLNDQDVRTALGKGAAERATQYYQWDKVRKQTETVYWTACETASSIK